MSRPAKYQFRLYVAGDAPNSAQAEDNLAILCEKYLQGEYEIEIVDVLKTPMLALNDNILMTPTLLKVAPEPVRRIVGALSQWQNVLDTLGLQVIVK